MYGSTDSEDKKINPNGHLPEIPLNKENTAKFSSTQVIHNTMNGTYSLVVSGKHLDVSVSYK